MQCMPCSLHCMPLAPHTNRVITPVTLVKTPCGPQARPSTILCVCRCLISLSGVHVASWVVAAQRVLLILIQLTLQVCSRQSPPGTLSLISVWIIAASVCACWPKYFAEKPRLTLVFTKRLNSIILLSVTLSASVACSAQPASHMAHL